MTGAVLIRTTLDDAMRAESIARSLVDERLAACVHILPPLTAIYRWQGRIETAEEIGLLVKTDGARVERAVDRIAELHPYAVPAILWWPVDVTPTTTAWLGESLA
ncbi:divalent-cation tolerance protein CutA [Sphingomonas sp. CJ99]